MDVQEAKLRKQLEGTGVSVTRSGDEITLIASGGIERDPEGRARNRRVEIVLCPITQ